MKQKILLCWNYERQSWIDQFEEIFKEEDYFFLNFFSRNQELENFAKAKVFYWEDFKSIDHVLKVTDPRIVVFMGLDGPYTLLLNYVCKQKGIPTYFLQHGIFHSYKAYKYEEAAMKRITSSQNNNYSDQNTISPPGKISFLRRSFNPGRLPVFIKILIFLLFKKITHSTQRALKFIAGEYVQADHYIVYTKYLSKILVERDKVPDHKFIEIGNNEANQIINNIVHSGDNSYSIGDNFLFIDEAFSGSEEYALQAIIPVEQYNSFLKTLADYSLSKKKKLKVKLHPFSYSVDHFVSHPNIEYIRHADTTDLIAHCAGVFGFTSTLLIPALFVKSVCIFKLNDFSHIHKALEKMNYCKVLDFHTFKPEDIEFKARVSPEVAEFIQYFLYKLDNKYMERLKQVLHTNLTAG